MHSTIIVDDEPDQQDILSTMLERNFPEYNVSRRCNSVMEALEYIPKVKPELVFLDVMMPPKTGFDLLNELKEINFEVVFCTSYEEYALRALKMSAVDFLLKPFGPDDLKIALEKFEEKILLKKNLQHIEALLHNINNNTTGKAKIALPTLSGFVFAEVDDIVHCVSDNVYTTFYFTNKTKQMVSRGMKECEELLNSYNFFRVHTSHLINLSYIKEYIKGDGGQVKMVDGSMIDVSRRRKEEFLSALKKL
ncbi:MAG: LytTR family DNA-binding domain-containing protein [Bacteroidia bacterium]